MKKDFLKYRYIFLIISFLVIVGGISYGLITGYKFDIDFKGGTVIQADLKEEFDNNEIEKIEDENLLHTIMFILIQTEQWSITYFDLKTRHM